MTEYVFEWDPAKAAENVRKHGVTFEEASLVFSDPLARSRYDDEHSSSEDERWVTLGLSRGVLLVVVHTFIEYMRTVTVRIISARPATRNERRNYEDIP
ncbi:MAG TPA: BrnT family toxin [Kofleriaceae bacterium]|nr:BrnT family toxin [Kofleriaceae bacterium]